MQLLYDLLPIFVFFIAYKIAGIYVATTAAIIVSILQVGYYRLRHGKFEKMQLTTLVMIVVLGGLTLILHKPIFIKWKVSVINWIFGLVFLGSHFIGKKPLIRYVMEKQIDLPSAVWNKLNMSWAVFFLAVGFVNLYVVYHFSTNAWVNFKLFGVLGLTFLFVILQAVYLSKHITEDNIKKKIK
jgi:intracellular septation protein